MTDKILQGIRGLHYRTPRKAWYVARIHLYRMNYKAMPAWYYDIEKEKIILTDPPRKLYYPHWKL